MSSQSESEFDTDDELDARATVLNSCSYSSNEISTTYHTAMKLKHNLDMLLQQPPTPWPPSTQYFEEDSYADSVPTSLFNFIALLAGESEEVPSDAARLIVDDGAKKKILSICHDIASLHSKGRRPMPKSLALGLALRHMTGSKKVTNLVSGLGHSPSYDSILRLETALATKHLEEHNNDIPSNFEKRNATTLVYDNIDFAEETLSGAGTTHFTNGIMFQLDNTSSSSQAGAVTTVISKRERTFLEPADGIAPFFMTKKTGPTVVQPVSSHFENAKQCSAIASLKDFIYIACKYDHSNSLPGWTGFSIMVSTPLPKSSISYLPVIKASSTELATVKSILDNAMHMADKLEVENIFTVFDQAIYSKAQQIRWQNPEMEKRLIIRMGEFHTAMSFLGMISKRFAMSGLEDVLVESGVLAAGSTRGVLTGHMYNRSMRCHKLMFESLARLQFSDFLDNCDESEKSQNIRVIAIARETVQQRTSPVASPVTEGVQQLQRDFDNYVHGKCADSPTYNFWNSYLKLVHLLLTFTRATRESDWRLHLASLRQMLGWFFAYDRINYSRYVNSVSVTLY